MLPSNFKLKAAQIIFSLDRGWNKVRLNDEVKAIAQCKMNIPKNKDEPCYEHEIEDIESIELTEQDPNCAHITLMLFKENGTLHSILDTIKRGLKNILRHQENF